MTNRDGLLPRMEARPWADGKTFTYRYHPVGGKPVGLGTDRAAAIRKVLDMNGQAPNHGSTTWVWERLQQHKRWLKLASGTRADYAFAWTQIDAEFGAYPMASITTAMIAQYVHVTRAAAPRRADVEKTLLSNLFKHAILLGVADRNPAREVPPHGSEPSTVMPADGALKALVKWLEVGTPQRRVLSYAARYAALAGNRQVEFLDLAWTQVDTEAGVIRVKRAKQRGARRGEVVEVIQITPQLKVLLAEIKALARSGLYLFPTRDGSAYSSRGFKTLWQRAVTGAIAEKVIKASDRFNFHALRRYYATKHRAEYGGLPDMHADPRVTARVYDATREIGRKAL